MPKVSVGRGEPIERALRRLKRKLDHEGVLKELRERKHYQKPSEKKRKRLKKAKR